MSARARAIRYGPSVVTLYTLALTIACCIAVAAVLTFDRRGRTDPTWATWATTSTFAVLAASCATLSTLAYAISGPGDDNPVALVIGDISMPLCLGLLLATMRRAAGHRRTFIVFSIVISTAVGLVTLLGGVDLGLTVKLIALALFSGLIVVTCVRGPLPRLGAHLVGWSLGAYGLYCLVRAVAPTLLGQGLSSLVAAVVIVLVVIGVVTIIRRAGRGGSDGVLSLPALTRAVGERTAAGAVLPATAITMPDLPLHRGAYGRAWAQALHASLSRAALQSLPPGSTVGEIAPGVLVALSDPGTEPADPPTPAALRAAMSVPDPAPADVPELQLDPLPLHGPADLDRYARLMRRTTRDATTRSGS